MGWNGWLVGWVGELFFCVGLDMIGGLVGWVGFLVWVGLDLMAGWLVGLVWLDSIGLGWVGLVGCFLVGCFLGLDWLVIKKTDISSLLKSFIHKLIRLNMLSY